MAVRLLLNLTFLSILAASSCNKNLEDLMMNKTPYIGSELRIDGYYYSDDVEITDYGLAVFYRDGVCYHLFGSRDSRSIEEYIEQEILLNESFINKLRTTPTNLGVFRIDDQIISIKHWEAARNILALKHFGEVINDTTFIMTEVETLQGEIKNTNYTYRFKQFMPKPDSTNTFIR